MEKKRKILIIVENLPVPFDTRVWQEATTLATNGYTVSVICPVASCVSVLLPKAATASYSFSLSTR